MFESANREQLEAINTISGPLLIVAGPGTGKTTTLIHRIANLVVKEKVPISRIMLATFTKKAAREFTRRLHDELERCGCRCNLDETYIGTFHSICERIIREHLDRTALRKNFTVKEEFDQKYFVYDHLRDFEAIEGFDGLFDDPDTGRWDKAITVCSWVNMLQEELVPVGRLTGSSDPQTSVIGDVLQKYVELREQNNFLDFTLMQTEVHRMLLSDPEVRREIVEGIDYVLVDEYQDTNRVQEELTLMLGSKFNNICVVGDEDQAIYRFRGATVRNILEFESHFDKCQKVVLTRNYRSHEDIVDFYNRWIVSTKIPRYEFDWGNCRHAKQIIAAGDVKGDYPPVQTIPGENLAVLNSRVVRTVKELVDNGTVTDLNQIAFIFPSVRSINAISLQDALQAQGYPVYSPRSNRFFDREEVRAALGILIEVFPDYKSQYFKGNNRPFAKYLKTANDDIVASMDKPEYKDLRARVSELSAAVPSGREKWTFSGLIYRVLGCEPMKGYIDCAGSRDLSEQRPARNISILVDYLVKFEKSKKMYNLDQNGLARLLNGLFNYYLSPLFYAGIEEYEDEEVFAPSGKICFYTIHQAKGLEFPVVFCGLPHYGPKDDRMVMNMNRLFEENGGRPPFEPKGQIRFFDFWREYYVAFSRAESLLFLLRNTADYPTCRCFSGILDALPGCDPQPMLRLKSISDRKLTRSYAFTVDVNNYDKCQTRYCLERHIGFGEEPSVATSFGILVHSTLEEVNKTVLREGPGAITAEFIRNSVENNFRTIRDADHVPLSGRHVGSAIAQVTGYVDHMNGRWDELYASEMAASTVHGDYLIEGKADLVLRHGDVYEIVDYKTGEKPDPVEDRATYESVRDQLRIYAYLLKERHGLDVRRITAYYTGAEEGNNLIEFDCSPEDIADTVTRFDSTVRKIEGGRFGGRSRVLKYCKNCQFRYYCGRDRS